MLLQVLDDGRLTDGQGRTVDFRNTVIVMTSNLGSQRIQELAGAQNYERMKAEVMEIVGQHFRPEFINRIDDVVVFHPLETEHIRKIVDIQLEYLHKRLADRDIALVLEPEARDRLAQAGFDPVYGARPLKRAIQQQLENPLAQRDPARRLRPRRHDSRERELDRARLRARGASTRRRKAAARRAGVHALRSIHLKRRGISA